MITYPTYTYPEKSSPVISEVGSLINNWRFEFEKSCLNGGFSTKPCLITIG